MPPPRHRPGHPWCDTQTGTAQPVATDSPPVVRTSWPETRNLLGDSAASLCAYILPGELLLPWRSFGSSGVWLILRERPSETGAVLMSAVPTEAFDFLPAVSQSQSIGGKSCQASNVSPF